MDEIQNTLELRLAPQKVDAIHRALLSGLLGNIATRSDAVEYTAARGVKCNIFPGSGLFKRRPGWIMAAELVETTRLYARTVAPIQPQWVERLASHLVQRTYSEPHWQPQSAHVAAFERGRPTLLFLQARDLLTREVHENKADYPDTISVGGVTLPLQYVFDPSDANDGVTVTIPLAALNQLPSEAFEWLVPGLLRQKVI